MKTGFKRLGGKLSGLGAGLHIPDWRETAGSNPSTANSDSTVIFWINWASDNSVLPDKLMRALPTAPGVYKGTWEKGKLCNHLKKYTVFYLQLLGGVRRGGGRGRRSHFCNMLCIQWQSRNTTTRCPNSMRPFEISFTVSTQYFRFLTPHLCPMQIYK